MDLLMQMSPLVDEDENVKELEYVNERNEQLNIDVTDLLLDAAREARAAKMKKEAEGEGVGAMAPIDPNGGE